LLAAAAAAFPSIEIARSNRKRCSGVRCGS
jgi:hypothetical protein